MYCESSDIIPVIDKDKFAKLLDDNGGDISKTNVNGYCTAASNLIDSALGGVYTVPITGTQSLRMLKAVAVDLTIEMIYERMSDMEIPKHIVRGGDRARATLDAYSGAGLIKPIKFLPDAPSNILPKAFAPDTAEDFTELEFSRATLSKL